MKNILLTILTLILLVGCSRDEDIRIREKKNRFLDTSLSINNQGSIVL